ncbi:MAG: M14 family zinc carboxypeptidase, partial [Longimicrobiales bacterium]|nr:M14 family zinc carboxypeptidase [Longimicrobiales bacterium]
MFSALAFALLLQVPPTAPLAPGAQYDPAIPTLKQVAGHDVTEAITSSEQIAAYFQALADAAPDRARLLTTGRSWEGRPTLMLVVGSAERMTRLDAVKADLKRLADPRGVPATEGERLVRELPVVTALIHGVHGNEVSSGGAALAMAYHLLAAQGDAVVDLIFRESLVLIDPMQNPDGRARFVFQNTQGASRWPDADPLSAEHDEGWPGGRGNHYLFDLNRDWFVQTQPETQGRVATLLDFMPHVVSDLHEMGGNSTYYFPPNAVPGNTWTTDEQRALSELFGQAMAGAFDGRGFSYFNRDTYDAFYPGYGVSWPMAQGAIGATYEMASARGLVFRRSDGGLLTYGDGVLRHFTA